MEGNSYFINFFKKASSDIIEVQKILENVNENTLSTSAKTLISSKFVKGDDISLFADQFVKELIRRIHKSSVLISLIKQVSEKEPDFVSNFSNSIIFHDFDDNLNRLNFFLAVRILTENGILRIQDICRKIKILNLDRTAPFYVIMYIIFSEEIKNVDAETYEKISYAYENACEKDFVNFDKSIFNVFCDSKKYLESDREKFINMITFGVEPDSLIDIIMNDDDDKFIQKYNENPEAILSAQTKNPNVPGLLREVCSSSAFCAYYGSVKCFKFLAVNNMLLDEYMDATVKAAAFGGNMEIIHILINKGADFSKALKYSIDGRNRELTEWILQNSSTESFNNIVVENCIKTAAENDDIRTLEFCIEYCKSKKQDINMLFKKANSVNKGSILHIIAANNSYHCLSLLSEFDNMIFNGRDNDGNTPLHLAVMSESIQTLQFLLSYPLVEVNPVNDKKETPLDIALLKGNCEIIQVLDQVNGINKHYLCRGKNLLAVAVQSQKEESVRYALELNMFSIYDRYDDVMKIIDAVAVKSLLPITKLIFTDDFPINTQLIGKKTPLHFSVLSHNDDNTKWLLERGAAINVQDDKGLTPLHYAVLEKSYSTMEILLNSVSKETGRSNIDVNKRDIDGETPLMKAVLKCDYNAVQILLNWEPKGANEYANVSKEEQKFLTKANVRIGDYYNHSLLVNSPSTKMTKLLQFYGANYN